MQDVIFSSIPMEQIKSELTETLRSEFKTLLAAIQPPQQQPEYLSRKEAARLLKISLVTLNEWQKNGIVPAYRISSRVRYKRSELETALQQIITSKTRRAA